MTIIELKQMRAKAVADMRAIMDRCTDAAMSAEDQTEYDAAEAGFTRISDLIDKEEQLQARERRMGEIEDGIERGARKNPNDKQIQMFARALTGNATDVTAYRNAYSLGVDEQAGYLTAPVQFIADLIKGLDDDLFMRRISHQTPRIGKAQSLGFPYIATDATNAEWEGETDTPTEETALTFGRREFKPNRMAKLVKISRTLINHAELAPAAVLERMRFMIAVTQEKAYMTGDGSGKPLGIFTASASGIPASRDVIAAKATSIKADELIDLKYSLKGQYHARMAWVMHRNMVKAIAKLKDNNGAFMWQPSIQAGQPDMLLGRAVHMTEYAPSELKANAYVAVLGDFRNYWICDADTLEMQVLRELYAPTNQIGYMFNYFGDGAPVVGEAFARLKMGTSDS